VKITNLKIANFLTIGDEPVVLSLDDRGMILIDGDNRDDTSTKSNGAGKSTIGDAICWVLYGETARGESGDDVINETNGKDCLVEVNLEDGQDKYVVTRHRKHKKHKNTLRIVDANSSNDLTKGTDKLTQELLEKILGCSIEVFRSAIYAAQDSMPNLPGMTDKALKEIVEEAAGVNRLTAAYGIAREELKRHEGLVSGLDINLQRSLSDLSVVHQSIADLEEKDKEFAANRTAEIARIATEIKGLLNDKTSHQSNPHLSIDEVAIQAEIDKLDAALTAFVATRNSADLEVKAKLKEVTALEVHLKNAASLARADIEAYRAVGERVGKPCGECGKPYCEDDLHDATKIAKQKAAVSKKKVDDLKLQLEVAKKAHSDAADGLASLGDIQTAIKKNKADSDELRDKLRLAKELRQEIKEIDDEILRKKKEIIKLKSAESPYTALIEAARVKEADLLASINELRVKLVDAEKLRDLASDAVKVFSPAGVRAHVLDTVTPMLNDRTAHYLSVLSDGNISAIWNTLSKTKSGELREKFSIDVTNEKGAKKFGGLSGGEKRKVRLAASLALQDLVASRASKPFDLMIGDEIDDALDEAGLERLMMLMEEKAREKGTVVVISHNSLSQWATQRITVVKEGGFSRLEVNT